MLEATKKEIYRLAALRVKELKESSDPEIQKELFKLNVVDTEPETLREFIASVPHVFTQLCPCVLMKPDDVAQHLPRTPNEFDLVIIGSASQLSSASVAGAIVRSKHIVVVGDADSELEFSLNVRVENILDSAKPILPTLNLTRNYRARHELLLTYANVQDYKSQLSIAPNVCPCSEVVNVAPNSTTYARAHDIIVETTRRFRDPVLRNQSLCIATFADFERYLLFDVFEKMNEEFGEWMNEQLTLTNIFSVQSYSADAFFLSIGGLIGDDKVLTLFLSLFFSRVSSRAIHSFYVFPCPDVPDETGEEESSLYEDLNDFFEITTNAKSEESETQAPVDNGVISAICDEIKALELSFELNVGPQESWIDIAVVSPQGKSNGYILGIQLDGKRYLKENDVYDREIRRPNLLKERGWNEKLYHVRSLDFFLNRSETLAKLREKLLDAKRKN